MKRFRSLSAAQTRKIGEGIGRELAAGDCVALKGALGAGKTTLVRGIVKGLGVPARSVSSPTFVLIHEYHGREKVYHMDWYRLKKVSGGDAKLVEECLSDEAVTLIEWPERGRALVPAHAVRVEIAHAGNDKRTITLR